MARRMILLAIPFATAACFVSESDCVQRGVVVDPCSIQAKAGQTIVLTAEIPGAPNEPVDWIVSASVLSAFDVTSQPNRLTLVSLQNVPGVYPIQASSQTDPLMYGGSAVGVSSATFSSQAPPFVYFGGDLPVGSKASATSAGGNLYYVAYAGVGTFLAPESNLVGPTANFFVRQYSLATNQLLREISGQFTGFLGTQTLTPIIPNVAADCAGNGYWVDFVNGVPPDYVLRRLGADGSGPQEQSLGQFTTFEFQTLSVACDGAIYYIGDPVGGLSEPVLFRIAAFGSPPAPVLVTPPELVLSTDSVVLDAQSRLIFGSSTGGGGLSGISRLVVDPFSAGGPIAVLDPTFNADTGGQSVFDVAVDGFGVVYAATTGNSGPSIAALNSMGTLVYEITSYEYFCPNACVLPICGTEIPFTVILSVAAAPNGALRIVDDPDTSNLPGSCVQALRFVLIDPQ